MKLVSFLNEKNTERVGLLLNYDSNLPLNEKGNGRIFDLQLIAKDYNINLPATMKELLNEHDRFFPLIKNLEILLKNTNEQGIIPNKVLAPVPHPTSCRDGYAFRQHVEAARRNRGLGMIPEFDQFPIFYFTNHNSIIGQGTVVVEKDHLEKLDFELEWAIVIGKHGRNISSKDADSYIAGFTIMNDLSARTLQMEEMVLNLGPAKGKDFATSIGPCLVTPDELEQFKIITPYGFNYNLKMTAFHNGKLVSEGNTKDMNWTFAEIIERASYGVDLYPGDVIGSGTVGTGCYLELNGTWAREAKEKGEQFAPVWLRDGDEIELRIEGIGILKNNIELSKNNISILEKKKNVI